MVRGGSLSAQDPYGGTVLYHVVMGCESTHGIKLHVVEYTLTYTQLSVSRTDEV